ncbi:MAG TPA: carboxymuconolactone decarboxylase [Xanthobacteraceae bacterium]
MRHPFTAALVAATFALPLAAAAQERYPELKLEQLSPEQKAYVEHLQKPPRSNTTALKNPPFKVYMRSPELADKLEAVSDYVRWGSGLQPRLTELAIMITARQWSSQWIWRGHYRAAVRGGLDPSVGTDIAAGKRPEKMKEDETILYTYAMEMYRDKAVSDATYAAAVKQFGEKGLIDLVATMGYYDTVAMTLITAKAVAPKEDDVPQLAALPR